MNLIILGPQGSGKGTQAEILAKKLNLFYFESGRFLRDLARRDLRIDATINQRGELLSDTETFALMTGFLETRVPSRDDILFDGYPRSVRQHELLQEWLGKKGKKVDRAIFLAVGEAESIRRLSARRLCEKCGKIYNLITGPRLEKDKCECGGELIQRPDDTPTAIKKRLDLYKAKTEPLIAVLEKEGILLKIDGERPVAVIAQEIAEKLGV